MSPQAASGWPYGDGEMAARIRRCDWARTPLGPLEGWPQSLKTTVELMLASPHMAHMAWGGGLIFLYNDAAAPLLGDRHPWALGRPVAEVWPDGPFQQGLDEVMDGRSQAFTDRAYDVPAKPGRPVWYTGAVEPLRDEAGAVVGVLTTGFDSSARVLAFRRQTVLLRELQHRVRNTLAMVRSIIRRTVETVDSAQEIGERLEGRIDALARTQAMLTRGSEAGMDLEMLVRDELLAQAAEEGRVTVGGPEVVLAPKAAEVLTLAMHELATNAVKYGALGGAGDLTVSWRIATAADGDADWLHLDWVETGVRALTAAPRPYGFGSELVEKRVAYELQGFGKMELKPRGMHARVSFPLLSNESILSGIDAISPDEGPAAA